MVTLSLAHALLADLLRGEGSFYDLLFGALLDLDGDVVYKLIVSL